MGSNPISYFSSWEASQGGGVHRVCVCVLVLHILGVMFVFQGVVFVFRGVVFVFLYFTFWGSDTTIWFIVGHDSRL